MKNLFLLSAVAVLFTGAAGCAGGDTYVYGHEVMTAGEITSHREFLDTAKGEELQSGLATHNEMVVARALDQEVVLKTEAQSRPQRVASSGRSWKSQSTGSRLGRATGSRTVAGVGGTANSVSSTPDAIGAGE